MARRNTAARRSEAVGGQFPEGRHARPAAQVLGRHVGNHPAHAVRRHDHADRRIGRPDLGCQAQRGAGRR
jgi:hypothetical protein